MDCASCVAKAEGAMKRMPGVSEVSVNLMAERLTLRLDQGGAAPASIDRSRDRHGGRASGSRWATRGRDALKGDVVGIARARTLSRAVMRNIRQNLFLVFVYNSLGVPLAAGVLYPFTGMLLSPIVAALAMALSSASVIGNALRLRAVRL
jgi:Cu+-exporting ATPase